MTPARKASTLILFQSHAYRILMVKRARQLAFFPNAWVFPGGRVDAEDSLLPTQGSVSGIEDRSFAVAALRECFEEAGVWIGVGDPTEDFRNQLNHRKAKLLDDTSLIADLDRLHFFSRRVTPVAEPKRYDTYFFLAQLTPEENPIPQADQHETVESAWLSPTEAIERHQSGEVSLAPPTLLTLMELARYDSFEALLNAPRNLQPIMPLHRKNPDLEILLPGHPLHEIQKPFFPCTRLRLNKGVWILD